MTSLSSHVLDATTGRPAADVAVTWTDGAGAVLAEARTDADGRIALRAGTELSGLHRLRFDTAAYFCGRRIAAFYPEVVIAFDITDPAGHYHVPLLLSPYAYSTYRGS